MEPLDVSSITNDSKPSSSDVYIGVLQICLYLYKNGHLQVHINNIEQEQYRLYKICFHGLLFN